MEASGGRLAVSWKTVKVGAALVLAIGLSGCYYPYGYYGNGYYGNYGYGSYRPSGPYAYQPYRPYYYSP
jgi:hypothetical protein